MKLKDDTPINSKKDDLLNRVNFAENLSKALINVESEKSFCVGLFGEWGAGKTSVINLFIEEIQDISKHKTLPILFRFEPWLISGQNFLIKYFLSELKKLLRNTYNSKIALKTSDLLHEYEKFFNNQSEKIDFEKNEIYNFDENVTFIKDMITKELKVLNNIIIIIIDDIDRLPDDEIIQIFKLIKSVADFPNIRYLTSFDKNIVVNALNKIQNNKGDEYLEKIIQVNFELPFLSPSKLQNLLTKEIEISLSSITNYKLDTDYWSLTFHNGFKNFFSNIRDIKRYINTLSFNVSLLSDSINIVDFLVIIAFQVFEQEIYYEIRNNKDLFTLGENEPSRTWRDNNLNFLKENRLNYEKIISKANNVSKHIIKNLLKIIFPKVKEAFDENQINFSNESLWRKNGRICSNEIFDNFFKLYISEEELSLIEIETILNHSNSESEFIKDIETLIKQNKIIKFIDRLEDYTSEDVPIDYIENIITVLMNMGDLFPEGEQGLFSFGTSMKLMRIFYQLLKRIEDSNHRLLILKKSMIKAKNSIFPLIQKISLEEQANGKDSNTAYEDLRLVNSEQLQELIEIAIKKVDDWISNRKIFSHPQISYILSKLSDWNQQDLINEIIIGIKENDLNIINFISSISGSVISSNKGFYLTIKLEKVDKFIIIEEVEKRLRIFFHSNEYSTLNERQKEAVKVFLDTYDGKIKNDFY